VSWVFGVDSGPADQRHPRDLAFAAERTPRLAGHGGGAGEVDEERPLVVAVELVDGVHRLGRESTGDLHTGLPAHHDDATLDVQREGLVVAHPGRSE